MRHVDGMRIYGALVAVLLLVAGSARAACYSKDPAQCATPVNGACGAANGQTVAAAPSSGLCSNGSASAVGDTGTTWAWSCTGSNGGTNASCSANKTPVATPVDGACGAASGQNFSAAPSSGLCSSGSASAVGDTGSAWAWSCAGNNGGASIACSAGKNQTSDPLSFVPSRGVFADYRYGDACFKDGKAYVLASRVADANDFFVDPDGTKAARSEVWIMELSGPGIGRKAQIGTAYFNNNEPMGALNCQPGGVETFWNSKGANVSNYGMNGIRKLLDYAGLSVLMEKSDFQNKNWGWYPWLTLDQGLHHFSYAGYYRMIESETIASISPADAIAEWNQQRAEHSDGIFPADNGKVIENLCLRYCGGTTAPAVEPENGLWSIDAENNGQSGRGFQVETGNGVLIFTYYGYRADGSGHWYLAAGALADGRFSGTLGQYRGGTVLGGSYVPANADGSAGTVNIAFTSGTAGTITLPGESTMAISKFALSGSVAPTVTPSNGLWIIDAENNGRSGRGFQIEQKNGILVFTYYGYDAGGQETWYLSAGGMNGATYNGSLTQYSGGTVLGGSYAPAAASGSPGRVSITFSSPTAGTITLPGESPRTISKFTW